jgi:hypothetical protein
LGGLIIQKVLITIAQLVLERILCIKGLGVVNLAIQKHPTDDDVKDQAYDLARINGDLVESEFIKAVKAHMCFLTSKKVLVLEENESYHVQKHLKIVSQLYPKVLLSWIKELGNGSSDA